MSYDARKLDASHLFYNKLRHEVELRDILTLMITAGADVYAADSFGVTVSNVAYEHGHWQVWEEVLEFCGYDAQKVMDGHPSHGRSSAVDASNSRSATECISKLSFIDYLQMRQPWCQVTEYPDWEYAEEAQIRVAKIEERIREIERWIRKAKIKERIHEIEEWIREVKIEERIREIEEWIRGAKIREYTESDISDEQGSEEGDDGERDPERDEESRRKKETDDMIRNWNQDDEDTDDEEMIAKLTKVKQH